MKRFSRFIWLRNGNGLLVKSKKGKADSWAQSLRTKLPLNSDTIEIPFHPMPLFTSVFNFI